MSLISSSIRLCISTRSRYWCHVEESNVTPIVVKVPVDLELGGGPHISKTKHKIGDASCTCKRDYVRCATREIDGEVLRSTSKASQRNNPCGSRQPPSRGQIQIRHPGPGDVENQISNTTPTTNRNRIAHREVPSQIFISTTLTQHSEY